MSAKKEREGDTGYIQRGVGMRSRTQGNPGATLSGFNVNVGGGGRSHKGTLIPPKGHFGCYVGNRCTVGRVGAGNQGKGCCNNSGKWFWQF